MLATLIRFSLIQRFMILALAAGLTAGGLWAFHSLSIDAFPDISSPQVTIIVKAPGMSPTEVEQRITVPIEMELQGLARQTVLRSTSKHALSSIVVDFADNTDIYWARQQVAERINQVWSNLPQGVSGGLAPVTTPLGDVFMYRIVGSGQSDQELRGIQDWVVRPRLRTVDGVADVNSLGGTVRAFEVRPRPDALAGYGVGVDDLEAAIARNNRNAGGDRIDRGNDTLLVRTVANLRGVDDIKNISIAVRDGAPLHIREVADVREGSLTRYGAVTADGKGEAVTGLVLLRKGANGRSTVEGVKAELERLKAILPAGVRIVPFYDRTELINKAVSTVERALAEAVVLVLLVLLVMLGNLRSALTVALILPLSVLFTFIVMRATGISANLMSLGGLAIAIGILVDAAVVVVENVHTHLSQAPPGLSRLHLIYRAVNEVAVPVLSGILIIIMVFLPLFSLTGLEGKMFKPLAFTISIAMIGSLLLSLTVIPVLASFFMRGGHGEDSRLLAVLKRAYLPLVRWALVHRRAAVGTALAALAGAATLFPLIGKEFMPVMDEGTTVVMAEKNPAVTLEHSLVIDKPIQRALLELPEVVGVVSRTGADELRMDPMGLNQTDNFLITRPRSEWKATLADFQKRLRDKLGRFQDVSFAFSQPIDMRVSEMLTGVRSAMAIKLYGDDLAVLDEKSRQIEQILSHIPGAVDVFRGRLSGQRYLQIEVNQAAISRYGISVEDVNRTIEVAVGGRVVSEIIEGTRRVGVQLRYPESGRNSPQALAAMLVKAPSGAKIPLNYVADIREVDGPVLITRESAKRQVVVQANVQNRDIVGFVSEVRAAVERNVSLPQGYYVTYGGQFENQQRASARLLVVIPVSIVLIFLMLFTTFRSVRQAGLIIMNIPFAMIGGIVSLFVSGLYLSVPASIGFIALFGVAVLNGVVMVAYFNQLRDSGYTVEQAVIKGAERRLRPVLMTALIASLGLVPMMLASGPGSELQRPLAVVVVGGLLTSTLLTLVLLPTLYSWLEEPGGKKRLERKEELQ